MWENSPADGQMRKDELGHHPCKYVRRVIVMVCYLKDDCGSCEATGEKNGIK